MPSEAQLLANRRNAQRSTGPRTEAGRARSCMNATKSGIYAKSEIIPGEDPSELEALKTRIYDSLQPSPKDTFDRIYRLQASTARILNRSLETLLRIRKLDLLHPAEQTNPIPGGAGASAPPPGFCPAQPGPEPDPTASQTDETNPIPAPPPPSPQPLTPSPTAEATPPSHGKAFPYGNSRYRYHPKR
jgi:hypothetical protein